MIKKNIYKIIKKFDGSPDYVARGLAIGVFVGITPTIPCQTALALGLAALCRGSKPAAVLGIWSGNPLTTPLLYAGCYRLGMLLLGRPAAALSFHQQSFMEFLKSGADLCCAALAVGVILGILPALAVYYITRLAIPPHADCTWGCNILTAWLRIAKYWVYGRTPIAGLSHN